MSNPNIFVTNVKFRGWYDAPFPFGKTEFTLTIETHDETDGSFRKGPALTLFIHSTNNPNTMQYGVQYEGGLAGDTVTGHYTFTYKTFLVNMNIKEKFSMTVTK